MSKGNNNDLKLEIMEQKDLVGKRVLIRLRALPMDRYEQRAPKPVFDRFSIVEVVGYDSNNTCEVIIDSKSLGWPGRVLRDTDVISKNAETYWYVNLNNIVEILN